MSLEIFAVRLDELMQEDKVSKHSLANKVKSERKSIRLWLGGKFYPRYDALIRIADTFDVSVNYLLGLSDKMPTNNFKKIEPADCHAIFVARVKAFMSQNKMTEYRMSKELKVGQTTFKRWFSEGVMPETASLIKVAELMDESVDFLLGREI